MAVFIFYICTINHTSCHINYHGTALILIEKEYASHANSILADADAKVVYINPLTTGDGAADSYLSGMWENLNAIRQVVE